MFLPTLEALEQRLLPSVTLENGRLVIRAEQPFTTVLVQPLAGFLLRVTENGFARIVGTPLITSGRVIFLGGPGGDVFLNETNLASYIRGGSGADTLYGGQGNDTIYGENGNDRISGASGEDRLLGMEGHDIVAGGVGNDSLFGLGGRDRLYGGDGRDSLRGGTGDDCLWGSLGDDTLFGQAGADRLASGPGIDRLDGNDVTSTAAMEVREEHLQLTHLALLLPPIPGGTLVPDPGQP
jgi:Ca2+-binding RTX toxin-like protein